jgi:succinate dehydrogenase / fumarate reductase flavoprotein subunit
MELNPRIPAGPLEKKWDLHRYEMRLVNPANKRKHTILVVGSGLAGASAAATLGELGYQVRCYCFQDSPRRAHSIAAQGGINAAKNYQNDGDSVGGCSTTPSRAETSAPAKPTSTGWRR